MRTLALLAALLLVATGLALPAVADVQDDGVEEVTAGEQVAAFMQTSETEVESAVEDEVFVASFENATNDSERAAVVENRTEQLEQRVREIERQMAELRAQRENGTIEPVAYRARMSALASRLERLNASVQRVQPRAAEVGIDESRLQSIRANASELAGPEVAAIAREVGGVDPPGPPADRGPPGNETGPGNDPSEGSGPPSNESDDRGGPPNGTDADPGGTDDGSDAGTNQSADGSDSGSDGSGDDPQDDRSTDGTDDESQSNGADAADGSGGG